MDGAGERAGSGCIGSDGVGVALAHGLVGLRGNLDEGDPHALPGSYLNSFYELRPLPYPKGGYGYPESGQAIINVTNGKLIRLLADGEPLDVRDGELRFHERTLDLRAGTLRRRLEWVSPAEKGVRVASERMVSLTQRAVAVINYEVEPIDVLVLLVVQSELFANEELPGPDEYSAVADNNVYTHLMAQRNLRAAADAVERHPEQAAALGVDAEEATSASWSLVGLVLCVVLLVLGGLSRVVRR